MKMNIYSISIKFKDFILIPVFGGTALSVHMQRTSVCTRRTIDLSSIDHLAELVGCVVFWRVISSEHNFPTDFTLIRLLKGLMTYCCIG